MKILIRSHHTDREVPIFPGDTVFDAILRSGQALDAYCGGNGSCGKCKVYWVQGAKEVLACKLPAQDGMMIETTSSNGMQILEASVEKELQINPVVQAEGASFGVALDLGTTTIVGYLLNLQSGKELAIRSMANPQRIYGADVISRIAYTQREAKGVEKLQEVLIAALNQLIMELCQAASVEREEILAMTIAANTVILHTLLGVSAASIAAAPFEPVFTEAKELTSRSLGLGISKQGKVFLLPSVSGYVGADIIGGLLVCDLEQREGYSLLLDIGTNGEIVLGNRHQMLACSTAAGPAFEGANISSGLAGVRGAIASFRLQAGERRYETVGGMAPLGICGSGLIDIVAELLTHDFVDSTGAFRQADLLEPWQREMLTTVDNQPAFVVVPLGSGQKEILFTQRDLREVQLAKGAVRAGLLTLLREAQIGCEEIETLYVAGGFGNFVDVQSACKVGLIPPELGTRVIRIGNGSGFGAKLCLLDQEQLVRGTKLKEMIRYIELSSRLDFQDFFMESMLF
ncbi:MAG: DUF4445 domain-containing protein [Firmicutes bacterium]|nr:DUF4445 domain-containing protein [Bacillota bacterium]